MAKKFMYVCLGILALVFHPGVEYGVAAYVEHSSRVSATGEGGSINYVTVLLDNGAVVL